MTDPKRERQRATTSSVVIRSADPEVIVRELEQRWIAPCLGDAVPVRWGPTSEEAVLPRIEVRLIGLTPVMVPRHSRALPPTRLAVRLAVAIRAATPMAADQALLALALGAGETGFPEIEGQAPALGVTEEAPGLVIRVELERERRATAPPLVREPLVATWSLPTTIQGRVLGPGSQPVAGALLEVPGSAVTGYSNHRGEFALGAVGRGGERDTTLVVSARGLTFEHRLAPDANPHEVVILLPFPESGP